jgi:hypothetical protein
MRKFSQRLYVVALFFSLLFAPTRTTTAADFKREVIYQIITDRSSTVAVQTTIHRKAPGFTIQRNRTGARTGAAISPAFNRKCRTSPDWV